MMKTCLVVDDSKVIRKVARHILEALHFNVEEAGDGREALDRCEAGNLPDVILLDWNMPVMSGMEFLRSLRGSTLSNRGLFLSTQRVLTSNGRDGASGGGDANDGGAIAPALARDAQLRSDRPQQAARTNRVREAELSSAIGQRASGQRWH